MRLRGLLFVFLLLALLPQELFPNSLYFPRAHSDDRFVTGIAISNTESTAGTLIMTLFDSTGAVESRRERTIVGGGQVVGSLSDLLGVTGQFQGWLRVESDRELAGMGLLFRQGSSSLSESPALTLPDMGATFAHVAVGAGWRTELAIANAGIGPAECRAILYESDGNPIGEFSFSLPALGHTVLDAGNIFKVDRILSGHIEVVSDSLIVTAETFLNDLGTVTIAGQREVRSVVGNGSRIAFPYVVTERGFWTGIAYVNQARYPSSVDVALYSAAGAQVRQTHSVLPAKAQGVFNVTEWAEGWRGSGYVVITASEPIVGLQVTGTWDTGYFTGWTAASVFEREAYIPHIAEVDDWASTFVATNLNSSVNRVLIEALDSNGALLQTAEVDLQPGQQLESELLGLLPLKGQGSGSLRIRSEAPVVVANVFANTRGYATTGGVVPVDASRRRAMQGIAVTKFIRATEGGQLTFDTVVPDDPARFFRLTLPPGALAEDTEITVRARPAWLPSKESNFNLAQYPLEFSPSGLQFLRPVTVAIPVARELLAARSIPLRQVELLTLDEQRGLWYPVRILRADESTGVIEVEISHFSLFSLQFAAPDLEPVLTNAEEAAAYILDEADRGASVIGRARELFADPLGGSVKAYAPSLSVISAGLKATEYWRDGNNILAIQAVVHGLTQDAAHRACETAFVTPQFHALCKIASDAVIAGGEAFGKWFGNFIGDMAYEANARLFDLQLNRYLGWYRRDGRSFAEMPKCGGGWLMDPVTQKCTGPDDHPIIFGCWDPLGVPETNFPCGWMGRNFDLPMLDLIGRGTIVQQERIERATSDAARAAADEIEALLSSQSGVPEEPSPGLILSPGDKQPAPFTVSFDASPTKQGRYPILGHYWDFRDGSTAEGMHVSHTFESPGTYDVRLSVYDVAGNMPALVKRITVLPSVEASTPASQATLTGACQAL